MPAQRHELGTVTLQRGGVLADAQLTYRTYGELAPDGGNGLLFLTWFTGQHPQIGVTDRARSRTRPKTLVYYRHKRSRTGMSSSSRAADSSYRLTSATFDQTAPARRNEV